MKVHIINKGITLEAEAGQRLLDVLRNAGVMVDAPCGGKGSCGKCKVLVDGSEVLSCRYMIQKDITVEVPEQKKTTVLTEGLSLTVQPDSSDRYCLAFDLGTTTVVAFLMDGFTGEILSRASCVNPQSQYGADVISRIQHAMDGEAESLSRCVRDALAELTRQAAKDAGIDPEEITAVSLVGNTAMHHLLLGIDPKPLTVPPYMPFVSHAMEVKADFLPVAANTMIRILPNIAGFVGADTVGCLVATEFDKLEEMTLMIDIGTNGEMVLGNKDGFLACSTAAGPAFEGAKISCGMRAADGAIDHVWIENGEVKVSVIGNVTPVGICGSALLDAIAVFLKLEMIAESGRVLTEDKLLHLAPTVALTQNDVNELQFAKGAIAAGIEMMAADLGIEIEEIQAVYLAGAFGNYMNPESACYIGLIPYELRERIKPCGNAAGKGSQMAAVSLEAYKYASMLAEQSDFLDLAAQEDFQDTYVEHLYFEEIDDE